MSTHLDDVLFAIGCLPELPTGAELQVWIERYPEHRREIIEFVTFLVELSMAPDEPPPTEDEVDAFVVVAMERLRPMIDEAFDDLAIPEPRRPM